MRPTNCSRCGGVSTNTNRSGNVINHKDADECISVLVRRVDGLVDRVEELESALKYFLWREGTKQP